MKKALKEYALKILSDHGCDRYTYGDSRTSVILDDLKEAYPNGMEYPYVDVANAIAFISKKKPIVKKKWLSTFSTDSTSDGVECKTLEEAKADVYRTYEIWMEEEWQTWKSEQPSEEEIERWNYMIWNCYAFVAKYNAEADEYEEYWYPSDRVLTKMGWKEI